jgi:hypothetical protein
MIIFQYYVLNFNISKFVDVYKTIVKSKPTALSEQLLYFEKKALSCNLKSKTFLV